MEILLIILALCVAIPVTTYFAIKFGVYAYLRGQALYHDDRHRELESKREKRE